MQRPLIIALLALCIGCLYAHAQQPDGVHLKADAQKLVRIISGDKAKIEAYCEATDMGEDIVEAAEENNETKVAVLMQRMDELEKILGPEYRGLLDGLYESDPDSKDVQDILAMLALLDQSCPE